MGFFFSIKAVICKAARLPSEHPRAGIVVRLGCCCHVPARVKPSWVIA